MEGYWRANPNCHFHLQCILSFTFSSSFTSIRRYLFLLWLIMFPNMYKLLEETNDLLKKYSVIFFLGWNNQTKRRVWIKTFIFPWPLQWFSWNNLGCKICEMQIFRLEHHRLKEDIILLLLLHYFILKENFLLIYIYFFFERTKFMLI